MLYLYFINIYFVSLCYIIIKYTMKEWYNKLKEWYNKNKKIINIILTLIFSVFIILTAIYIYNKYNMYKIKKTINDFIMGNLVFNGGTKNNLLLYLDRIKSIGEIEIQNSKPGQILTKIKFQILFKIHKAPYEILFVRSNDGSNITYFMCFRSIFTLGFWYYYSHTDTDNLHNKFIHIELQSFFTSHVNKTNIILFNELLDFMIMNDMDYIQKANMVEPQNPVEVGIFFNNDLVIIHMDGIISKLNTPGVINHNKQHDTYNTSTLIYFFDYEQNNIKVETSVFKYIYMNSIFINCIYKIKGIQYINPNINLWSPVCLMPEQDNPIMPDGRYSKYNAQFMQPFIKITDIDDVDDMLYMGGIKIDDNYIFVGNI
jgi:hypothetical protein